MFRSLIAVGVLALAAVPSLLLAGAKKAPNVAVQFVLQADQRDGTPFVRPIQWQGRVVYVSKISVVTEHDFTGLFPYRAADGSFAAAFRLNDPGRLALQTISVAKRGGRMYAIVNGRVVTPIAIDRIVSDGIISIPLGLTELEIRGLGDRIPVMPEAKKAGGL